MFAALRHRNYRLFFAGQLISLVGTWMQSVAQGWLVYQLTGSELHLGLVAFATGVPVTLLTLPAGAVADRVSKRAVLVATQTVAMTLAFTLAWLTYRGTVTVPVIAALGFLLGVTNAFDMPTRQSFVVEMVNKNDLMNAIALNSSLFNGARVVGPALAGILIAAFGVAGCFFFNGLSFVPVIFGYLAMRLPARPARAQGRSLLHETREALQYVAGTPGIRATILLMSAVSLFGLSYAVLMPVFARDVLGAGARGLGWLTAAHGVGALAGALTLASLGNTARRGSLFLAGLFGFCAMMFVFAFSRMFWLSFAALTAAGWFMVLAAATANTSVQLAVPDGLRGRVMGLYVMAFIGLVPFGSMLTGAIAAATSAPFAVALGAGVCALTGLGVMRQLRFDASSPAAA